MVRSAVPATTVTIGLVRSTVVVTRTLCTSIQTLYTQPAALVGAAVTLCVVLLSSLKFSINFTSGIAPNSGFGRYLAVWPVRCEV